MLFNRLDYVTQKLCNWKVALSKRTCKQNQGVEETRVQPALNSRSAVRIKSQAMFVEIGLLGTRAE